MTTIYKEARAALTGDGQAVRRLLVELAKSGPEETCSHLKAALEPLSPDLEVGLSVLMTVNTLGSGADVIAAILVLSQVPPKACLCFRAGRAYWRSA